MNALGNPLAQPRNGFGVAAFALGLLALLLSWTAIGGIVLGIPAVIFGVLGRGRARRGEATNGGLSMAGIVLGVVGVLIAILIIAFWASVLNTPAGQTYFHCIQQNAGNPSRMQECANQFIQHYRRS
jgi:hypothetical protein